ncbi:Uu.00g097420.m01.CDS01 [Anthostomella pinea]|uniref:Uu.00g097420.m01.CDS01 n=1 Tax=Anthostomella pinea TaxID=933095 RepID=A0AAI8VCH0_9PEZI|nr:Uu.00g097420.m01.CDS01 [Anthostomella pinea]
MAGLMSKRQQARNEKALQDLKQNVAGNNTCADCGARNPAWASWSLGVFLCMRCATIHRKLGTHISKVKSLSMDSWSNDQVESMKRVGNASSNMKFNPQNKKPPVPIDADEADSAMERFIRSKYAQPQTQTPANGARRHNTGNSDEGTPPPLPPKTGGRFFKSGTLSFRSKKDARSPHDGAFASRDLPPRNSETLRNKPSKVFGASVHQESPEATAQKLTQLRDMGFTDDKRNAMILKGVNGNLEKTIEALVRLGEGGISSDLASARESQPLSRSLTPQPTKPITNGLSRSSPTAARSPTTPSNNPWDIQPAQPQSSQSTGTLQNRNPFFNNNPFGIPPQQAEYTLNQSLQNLSLAPSQLPLFPHHTGGVPASQPISQPLYPHSMTPPIPQTQNFGSAAFNGYQNYQQPVSQPQQPQQQQQQNNNPFLQAPAAVQPSLSLNTSSFQHTQGAYNGNPFTRSPTRIASPTLSQIPEQSQQNVYSASQTPAYGSNPFFAMNQPAQSSQPLQQPWYESQQPVQAPPQGVYQPQRADTASIMAMYNYPHLAPTGMQSQEQAPQNATEMGQSQQVPSQYQAPTSIPRSASNLAGTNNPFLNSTAAPAPAAFAPASNTTAPSSNGRSRESMTMAMDMAWNNGRHSPDAFASLSARSG